MADAAWKRLRACQSYPPDTPFVFPCAVYDNRMEANFPVGACGPCTCNDQCVIDQVSTTFFDRVPFRSGVGCKCIPMTCCGPPVLFSLEPKCCMGCVSMAKCYGVPIMASPCNLWGCRSYVCIGKPCYLKYAYDLTGPLSKTGAESFVTILSAAMGQWRQGPGSDIGGSQMAVFDMVAGSRAKSAGGAIVVQQPATEDMER